MILDLDRFLRTERPYWEELESLLDQLDSQARLDLAGARRLHALYERASADLAKLSTFAAEPESRRHLESLVGRAYAEIHQASDRSTRFKPFHWFWVTFPGTFRRHFLAFILAVSVSTLGGVFGAIATIADPDSRHVTMPFGHADMRPSERVRMDETDQSRAGVQAVHASFSSQLMTHNTRVSIVTLSLGMTWGIGTLIVLFVNGVGIGAIAADYVLDGQATFLAGWILPHGSIELPAIFIAGQAGLVLANCLLGRRSNLPLATRLRRIAPDLVTLIGGVAILLVYAGIIEAVLSQYHAPVLPYSIKITFGLVELGLLILFLGFAGRSASQPPTSPDPSP